VKPFRKKKGCGMWEKSSAGKQEKKIEIEEMRTMDKVNKKEDQQFIAFVVLAKRNLEARAISIESRLKYFSSTKSR
jgi:hypothetical protein